METIEKRSRLTFIRRTRCTKNYQWYALYKCECGNEKEIVITKVENNVTLSCGCLIKQSVSTHGLSRHPLSGIWTHIKDRCYNEKCPEYKYYGGRGINVCSEWLNNSGAFIKWGIENGWEKGLEIDRRENDGDYEPANCRFVTKKVNANNKRSNIRITYNGEERTLSQWSEHLNIPYGILYRRVSILKIDVNEAFTKPAKKCQRTALTFNDKTKNAKQWAEEIGISYVTFLCRIKKGWSIEKAILTPLFENKRSKRKLLYAS